eukprot:scaffold49331_cov69-Phaeocystis_antarctica.AAC.3
MTCTRRRIAGISGGATILARQEASREQRSGICYKTKNVASSDALAAALESNAHHCPARLRASNRRLALAPHWTIVSSPMLASSRPPGAELRCTPPTRCVLLVLHRASSSSGWQADARANQTDVAARAPVARN